MRKPRKTKDLQAKAKELEIVLTALLEYYWDYKFQVEKIKDTNERFSLLGEYLEVVRTYKAKYFNALKEQTHNETD